jgi:hypothetical protein
VGLALGAYHAQGAAAGRQALAGLQQLLAVSYGASHFAPEKARDGGGGGGGGEWLYATVLVASAQFELAAAYLHGAAHGALRADALHLALGLHGCGLLATTDARAHGGGGGGGSGVGEGEEVLVAAVGPSGVPQLRLSAMLESHGASLFAQSRAAGLRYGWLVAGEELKVGACAAMIVTQGATQVRRVAGGQRRRPRA